jgi:hypothetical protein
LLHRIHGENARQEYAVKSSGTADRGDRLAEATDLIEVGKISTDQRPETASDIGQRRRVLASLKLTIDGAGDYLGACRMNDSLRENAMSDEDLKAELERLRIENAALKKGGSGGIRMKVSEKGAVSVYGMGRFPVTLYKEQWLRLLDMSDEIRSFIAANQARLKAKE